MIKVLGILIIVSELLVSTAAISADRVVVVPMGGAKGDALASDVVKGKTFSSNAGKGLTGTLVLPPNAQAFTNSKEMVFHLVPAGTFSMGSPAGEPGRLTDEPQHQVTLTKSFYIQTTEVTQKQWFDIFGNNPATSNIGNAYPIETVNWFEAAAFANALSQLESRSECYVLTGCTSSPGNDMECSVAETNPGCTGYRLPTEAEWEYAARADTTAAYANPYSFDINNTETDAGFNSNLHAMGWYEFNNESGDLSRINSPGYPTGTKPVAQKQSNKWGLYDMHGNVWELCQDWYKSDYYTDPGSDSDPQGPSPTSHRVKRGGAWDYFARYARSARRDPELPGEGYNLLGFRLVLPSGQ